MVDFVLKSVERSLSKAAMVSFVQIVRIIHHWQLDWVAEYIRKFCQSNIFEKFKMAMIANYIGTISPE